MAVRLWMSTSLDSQVDLPSYQKEGQEIFYRSLFRVHDFWLDRHTDHIAFAAPPVNLAWAERIHAGWPAGRSELLLPRRILTDTPFPIRHVTALPSVRPQGELPLAFRLTDSQGRPVGLEEEVRVTVTPRLEPSGRVPDDPQRTLLQTAAHDPSGHLYRTSVDAGRLSEGLHQVEVKLPTGARHHAYLQVSRRPDHPWHDV